MAQAELSRPVHASIMQRRQEALSLITIADLEGRRSQVSLRSMCNNVRTAPAAGTSLSGTI
jgi:hypothetical protein